jgi:hypothetical protein
VDNASLPEKRQHRRVQKSCEAEFYANDETYKGVSDNFSINGLFIGTDNLLPPQSMVSIIVHLPDGSIAKLKGRVIRVQEASDDILTAPGQTLKRGMGIEIMERDSNYMKFLMSLLSSITF